MPDTYNPDRVENDVVAALAREASQPVEITEGLYLLHNGTTIDVRKDLEKYEVTPRRKIGSYTVTDVESFMSYLEKHGQPLTELWANDKSSTIRAVINAHGAGEHVPGWQDHTVTLQLPFTQDWRDWTGNDNKLMGQSDFAAFIEDHLPNFVSPTGADMLELAQSFQATTKVDFDASRRLQSGETQLTYVENTTASAGKKGSLAIPDTFELALQVHERGPVYKVKARFRYRINDGTLRLAYHLDRIDDVRRHAFDEVVEKVGTATSRQVWSSTS
jgi:uncharacterized protein YfdQ (DUF2303 family)